MKRRIRLTEGELKKIVNKSVKRVLREWADGTETVYAYHVASIGDVEDQEEADEAYHIYDLLSHNEIDADEAINMITNGDFTPDGMELEAVGRGCRNYGESKDGRYFLTYDSYTGALDVWEKE